MPDWQKSRCGGSLLVVMVLGATLTGCGNNRESNDNNRGDRQVEAEHAAKGQEAEGTRPIEADLSGKAQKLTTGKCTLTGSFREYKDDAIAVEEFSGSTLYIAARWDGGGGRKEGTRRDRLRASFRGPETGTEEQSLPCCHAGREPEGYTRGLGSSERGHSSRCKQ